MSNLIPEPRPDVNGKITTRWVRSAPQVPNKALLNVPPSLSERGLNPVTAESVPLLSALIANLSTLLEQHAVGASLFKVEAMHPLAAQRIEETLVGATEVSPLRVNLTKASLCAAMLDALEKEEHRGRAEQSRPIHNFAVLGYSNGENQGLLVAGLQTLSEFRDADDFLFDLPPEAQKRAAALYRVTASVPKNHLDIYTGDEDEDDDEYNEWDDSESDYSEQELGRYIKLRNDELASYVMDHADRIDEILAVINERGTDDVNAIRGILDNNDAPALSRGVL